MITGMSFDFPELNCCAHRPYSSPDFPVFNLSMAFSTSSLKEIMRISFEFQIYVLGVAMLKIVQIKESTVIIIIFCDCQIFIIFHKASTLLSEIKVLFSILTTRQVVFDSFLDLIFLIS